MDPIEAISPRHTEHCAITADGQLAAISSSGGFIEIWDVAECKVVRSMRTLERQNQLQFFSSAEGNHCLMSVGDDCLVRIWKMPSDETQWKPYDFTSGQSHKAGWIERVGYRLIYSPDGKLEFRAAGSLGTLHMRETGQPKKLEIQHRNSIKHAAFSDDGRRLITADAFECKFHALRRENQLVIPWRVLPD